MKKKSIDSFGTLTEAALGGQHCSIYSIPAFEQSAGLDISNLPYSKRVLLENLLRHEDNETVSRDDIMSLALSGSREGGEIAFYPARVLMPDSSGVPLLADLASMRDRAVELGGSAELINPSIPVDFVVDHSVITQFSGTADSLRRNMNLEYRSNEERYKFLKWSQGAFENLRIVPPGNGILHQINLEYLAQVVSVQTRDNLQMAYPDTLVGMDSHTPMVNGLSVLGWGVGGIEAGSAMLGEPISMLVPAVVGCRLTGSLPPGSTATDLVLCLTEALRRHGVVGKFVEFCGPGLAGLALPDRATVANMAPEYGATMGFFPIDEQTIRYLRMTGRPAHQVERVERYARMQKLWRHEKEPRYEELLEFDLDSVRASLAGPRRPQDRNNLQDVALKFQEAFKLEPVKGEINPQGQAARDGDIAIAAITSCTNTSNPALMIAAGLLARNAVRAGLRPKPWVKTSLAPGSRRVDEYLAAAGLNKDLDALGFQVVGYGCMTCMGGAGDLLPDMARDIKEQNLTAVAVLSGNRNFDARIHPALRANYLASPPLVVAYALAGSIRIDLTREPLGHGSDGKPVFLKDLWPGEAQVQEIAQQAVRAELFEQGYSRLFDGDPLWNGLGAADSATFPWDPASTYIRRSPYADAMGTEVGCSIPLQGARILLMLGDDVTTDHISPVGATGADSAVGKYLISHGVKPKDFNLLITRRANPDVVARTAISDPLRLAGPPAEVLVHRAANPDVVARTAFSNVRLRNLMAAGVEGGVTRHVDCDELSDVFSVAERYRSEKTPLIVVGGKNYGAGSSRDTAAKGTALLGVRAVIAEGFERIHRSNLVGMGVLPLQFPAGTTRESLGLQGNELVDVFTSGLPLSPAMPVQCRFTSPDGSVQEITATLRVDTPRELRWINAGGILPFVGNELLDGRQSTAQKAGQKTCFA